MPRKETLRQLVAKLPPKQQALDFFKSNLWEQLPRRDQQACCQALAKLLVQVTRSMQENENNE